MVYVVPLVCLVIPLIMAVVLVRNGVGWAIPVLMLVGVGAIFWAISEGQKVQGWDGMGYAIFAMLMVAPAILGMLIGGVIGWVRQVRARRAGPQNPA